MKIGGEFWRNSTYVCMFVIYHSSWRLKSKIWYFKYTLSYFPDAIQCNTTQWKSGTPRSLSHALHRVALHHVTSRKYVKIHIAIPDIILSHHVALHCIMSGKYVFVDLLLCVKNSLTRIFVVNIVEKQLTRKTSTNTDSH